MKARKKIALGTTPLGQMSPKKAQELINVAVQANILEFDTAPIYGNAEKYLGNFYRQSGTPLKVNTKYGLPLPKSITKDSIRISLEKSLDLLAGLEISTLFLHSIPMKFITEDVFEILFELQNQGYFESLGYSGDNEDLEEAISTGHFRNYMLTINILDLSNYRFIHSMPKSSRIFLKRPLANAIWRNWWRRQAAHYFFSVIGAGRSFDRQNYRFRFSKLKRIEPQIKKPYIRSFTNFLCSLDFESIFVLGTSNAKHLKEFSNLVRNECIDSNSDIVEERLEAWRQCSMFNWRAVR